MNEKTPFQRAFPELDDLPDKMTEVREKVMTGELSCREAQSILKGAEKDLQAPRKKVKILRRMP